MLWEPLEPDKKGKYPRDMEVVTMIEASRRAQHGEPVVRREREGWRYVMSFCKNDVLEWKGENPGLKRVATFSVATSGQLELVLSPLADARKNREAQTRLSGKPALAHIVRRISFDPVGFEVGSEPPLLP